MTRAVTIFLLFLSMVCLADVAHEPWPKKLKDFPMGSEITIQGFKITIRQSADQEGAGSGGRCYDFIVQNTHTGAKQEFEDQSVGVAVLALYHGWPQFEVWGRAGGRTWCRSLHRFTGKQFEYVRTDEFTVNDLRATDKTRTTTMPGNEDLLYYVETRLPEK